MTRPNVLIAGVGDGLSASLARTYRQIAEQDRSAWTSEIALRPWVETF